MFVYLAGHNLYRAITGAEPPPSPVSARSYTEHGLGVWFELDDESLGDMAAPQKLSSLKSASEIDAERGLDTSDESAEIGTDESP